MNKEIELLYKKLDAQDSIIDQQALEKAQLQLAKDNLQKDYQEAVDKITELQEQLEDTTTELFRANKKISDAIGYANERINYCYHNEIDTTDWEEIFEILGDIE